MFDTGHVYYWAVMTCRASGHLSTYVDNGVAADTPELDGVVARRMALQGFPVGNMVKLEVEKTAIHIPEPTPPKRPWSGGPRTHRGGCNRRYAR